MLVRPHFQRLVERVRMGPAVTAGFVYPCDRESLQLALSGAFAGFITPTLIGPEAHIRDAASKAGLDITRIPIANTEATPQAAVKRAIALARDGRVRALVKGAITIEDLLAPIAAADSGIRSEHRLSHAYFVDLPGRSQGLLFADALLNIMPTLGAKKDIIVNTLELARAIGVVKPRVAIIAAMSAINQAFPSTLDAAALKMMADQGAFAGAVIQGPMTIDSALSAEAAHQNGARGEVAGHADVIIAPSLEAASLTLRALTVVTGGFAAGIVLGAILPIITPARTDSLEVCMASCVLAALHGARTPATMVPTHAGGATSMPTTVMGHATV